MKKLFVFILTFCLLLVSCQNGKGTEGQSTEKQTNETTAQETESSTMNENTTPTPEQWSINVMSFNIHYLNLPASQKSDVAKIRNHPDGTVYADTTTDARLSGMIAMIEGEAIDVFGVQEMRADWRNAFRKSSLDDSYDRAGDTNTSHSEGGYIYYRKDKFKLIEEGKFFLTLDGDRASQTPVSNVTGSDRICSWALLRCLDENGAETDRCFLFMDTHFTATNDITVRERQATTIVTEIPVLLSEFETEYQIQNCPVVLVGDFNTAAHDTPYVTLTADLTDSFYACEHNVKEAWTSAPSYNYVIPNTKAYAEGNRIDFIFVNDAVTVLKYKMIHTTTNVCEYGAYLSDHNAIVAKITFE